MNTSYYAKRQALINPVSIAARAPEWYKGRQYKKLAPNYWFFKKYKEDHDESFYTKCYYEEILSKLDPQTVFKELGEDATILCWEKSGEFCHRRLVAAWLQDNLNIEISEL
jgi:hypothetical protein